MRGPGVLDMKGGIATVHAALSALSAAGHLAAIPLAFVSVADEEVGSPDSRPFTAECGHGAPAPPSKRVAPPTPSSRLARARAASPRALHGKAAHAGNAHADGINAIWALARFVDAAQALTDYGRGVTVNVGTISGGTSKNTVPDRAECVLDFRMVARADGERVMTQLEAASTRIARDTGARIELDGGIRRPPLEPSEGSGALYRRYAACAAAEGLGDGESPSRRRLGCQRRGGPRRAGDRRAGAPGGRGFHTHDEHIELPTLLARTRALIRFLAQDLPGGGLA